VLTSTPDHPRVRYSKDGASHEISCDFIAGCDGFTASAAPACHGTPLPTSNAFYPLGWLGLLSDTPPVSDELIYVKHERGFALCSMRSHTRSRYYLQCPLSDKVEQWSD